MIVLLGGEELGKRQRWRMLFRARLLECSIALPGETCPAPGIRAKMVR
jgi:hypothetical protein